MYIIGIFLGIIVGLASATLYYQNKIQLLKFGFESESESVESGFLSQIENIRNKLISSQYDYEEIFAERNELQY